VRLAIVAAVLAIAVAAYAQSKPEPQRMRFVETGDVLTVSTLPPGGIGKLFDAAAYEALSSGIPSTVVIRIQITPRDSDTPVAEQLIQRSAVRDVWDDIYIVRLDQPSGQPGGQPGARKTFKVKYRAEALKWLTAIEDLPVAKLDVLPLEQIFVLKMVVELNPVSKETLAEVRRWLSQGNTGGLERGGTFFGSFVSVFYNPKIADADQVLRIHSQPFFRPPP
jgi:hypothetical protein